MIACGVVGAGDLELDENALEVSHTGRRIRLSAKPFELLERLARDVGRVVTKDRLMVDLWPEQIVSDWALTSAVREVRRGLKALGVADEIRVESVRRRGYRLTIPGRIATERPVAGDASAAPEEGEGPGRLVGRRAETARLAVALEDALAGRPRMLLVTGAAGIGKSRLATQLEALAAARGADVLWGRCQERECPPLWPWAEIVRALAHSREPDEMRELLRAAAPDLAHVLPSVRALFPAALPPRPSDPELARLSLLDGFLQLFERVAARRPCVFIVDDVQWADSSSLVLLRSLARRHGGNRLLVVALYRTDEVEPPHPASDAVDDLGRDESVMRVDLGPLSDGESRELLETLGSTGPDDPRLEELGRIAGGNPFFLRELYRHLSESFEGGPLPREIERLVVRRLERRTTAAQRVVAYASVLGMDFHADLLRAVAEADAGSIEGGIDVALDELARAGLIEAPAIAGDPYRFAHSLTRQATYAGIPPLRRAELHHVVGECLEASLGPDVPPERAAQLAEHFDRASDVGGAARAFEYRLQAGEDAARRLSFVEAARHFTRAAVLFDAANPLGEATSAADAQARDGRRCALLISLTEAARKAGDGTITRQAWEEALPIARRLDDPGYLARLVVEAPFVFWEATRLTVLSEEVVQRLDSEATPFRAVALANLAARLRDTPGSRGRREALLAEALEITAGADDPAARLYVLDAYLSAMDQADLLPERLRYATEMHTRAAVDGGVWVSAQARAHRHSVLLQQGRLTAALEEVRELRKLAERHPWPRLQWLASGASFVDAFVDGRLAEAEELCRRAGELAFETGQPTGTMALATQLSMLRREQGRLGEVLPTIEAFVAERPPFAWTLDLARASLGDGETLERLLASTVVERSAMLRHEAEGFRIIGLVWLIDACAACGHAADLEVAHAELASRADTWTIGGTGFYTSGSIRRSLGNLELLRGRSQSALDELKRAAESHAQPGATLFRLWTGFDVARALQLRADPGDREQADRLLGDTYAEASRRELVDLCRRIEAHGRTEAHGS